jgi:hypothetical protein
LFGFNFPQNKVAALALINEARGLTLISMKSEESWKEPPERRHSLRLNALKELHLLSCQT